MSAFVQPGFVHPAFALASEYLADFLVSLNPAFLGGMAHMANAHLASHWDEGALDQALEALRKGDGAKAVALLGEAAKCAAVPVPASEADSLQAQAERDRMALAVRVVLALMPKDQAGEEVKP